MVAVCTVPCNPPYAVTTDDVSNQEIANTNATRKSKFYTSIKKGTLKKRSLCFSILFNHCAIWASLSLMMSTM